MAAAEEPTQETIAVESGEETKTGEEGEVAVNVLLQADE